MEICAMPWKAMNAEDLRREFISQYQTGAISVTELCRRYGISRQTGHKLIRRYDAEGEAGLLERSRRPASQPRRTSHEIEQKVISLRTSHPVWGSRKLRKLLEREGVSPLPAMSTITQIISRNHLAGRDRAPQRPFVRFERPVPNALWQMDFKGWFSTLSGPCHPLGVIDDRSRFNILLRALPDEQTKGVKASLCQAFERYGIPDVILTDNGAPWGCDPEHQYTPLVVWLIKLQIRVAHSRPYHPQTQGKEERFHRTLKEELLGTRQWRDLVHCQKEFDSWRMEYNHIRPHQALEDGVPAGFYHPSLRSYSGEPLAPEYPEGAVVRKVQHGGLISFRGRYYKVPKAFRGESVRLVEASEGFHKVLFGSIRIASIQTGQTP